MMQPIGIQATQKYDVNLPNQVEELSWTYYHYQMYAAAGQTSLTFFNAAPGTLSVQDYNLELAGQIPAGKKFVVQGLAVDFQPSENPVESTGVAPAHNFTNDTWAVAKNGYLKFTVGSKDYVGEGPLGNFPCTYRLAGQAAAATTVAATSFTNDYAAMSGQPHWIIPVVLTSSQNFKVELTWATAIALPSSAAGRIGVRLYGRLFRNAQ
jgi:hypothetical protein